MICPVCKRDLAPTLSICLTCGAMMNDTVREELQSKIAPSGDLGNLPAKPAMRQKLPLTQPIQKLKLPSAPTPARQTLAERPAVNETAASIRTVPKPAQARAETAGLGSKKTSPTLVEFQNKNATLPDWRLQLQNSIRQRNGMPRPHGDDANPLAATQKHLVSGANALKAETAASPAVAGDADPRLASALKRIENSRQVFSTTSTKAKTHTPSVNAATARSFPFDVVTATPRSVAARFESNSKPRLVSSLRIEKKGLDTNKLLPINAPAPSISETAAADPYEILPQPAEPKKFLAPDLENTDASRAVQVDAADSLDNDTDEFDDLAPFSMRFGAGVFDLLIGAFATAILLSPLVLSGGEWVSLSGAIAFAAALSIVLFLYLTATIGFVGRSFGMRLFSLELIDAEENVYPTLHQAAVSSSVYILSVAFGGLGFIPALYNEEKRAVHDLLSGTILIREF